MTSVQHRVTSRALPPPLDNMAAYLRLQGDPQAGLRCVHIAGTNGKGSTAAFLERILREAGLRTGLFTSPHLLRYNERIRVNGEEIPNDALEALTEIITMQSKAEGIPLNYFQIATAVAFLYFRDQLCDIVLLECGLGGRLDPTNVIEQPVLSLITRIGMDHMAQLGDTIEAIAAEKAGIIKTGVPTLLIRQEESVVRIVEQACYTQSAALQIVEPLAFVPGTPRLLRCRYGDILPGIGGLFQAENAALAIAAAEALQAHFPVREAHIQHGVCLARWRARFERLQEHPPLLFDGAHNPQGVHALMDSLVACYPHCAFVFILGTMADKSYAQNVEIAAKHAHAMIAVAPHAERALPISMLAACMRQYHSRVHEASDMQNALHIAQGIEVVNKVICVFGSFYLSEQVYPLVTEAARDCAKHSPTPPPSTL